jgi:VAD1 Analog of StAR-related lipid transfer domain
MYPESKPGERYLIDAECFNGGVPYSDHFCTVIRYCMVRTGPRSTRLNITGRVVYLKNVFMLKGMEAPYCSL